MQRGRPAARSWLSLAARSQPAPAQSAPLLPPPAQPPRTVYAAAMDARTRPVCAGCHERQVDARSSSPRTARRTTPQGSMCQACHGDATEHLKDPTKAKPANPFSTPDARHGDRRSPNVCLTCHIGAAASSRSGNRASTRSRTSRAPTATSIHGKETQSAGRAVHDELPAQRSGHLRHVPPADPLGDHEAVAPSDHREQDEVLGLPQPARGAVAR